MTPVPFELPLRPSEAAVLAELIYEQSGGRPLTDDVRNRLAGRAATLGITSVRPYFGSLQEDAVQGSAYYLAVDGLSSGKAEPLLLHLAPATAAGGGLHPHPLLIGRMRPGGGREIIMTATPFGPSDHGTIALFAESAGRCFLPRPHGAMTALRAELTEPGAAAPVAFQAFQAISRSSGRQLAAILLPADARCFWEMVWAAIRTGYRENYSAGGPFVAETARLFTFFTAQVKAMEELVEALRALRDGSPYDLEIDLTATPAGQIRDVLDVLRLVGRPAQAARVNAAPHSFNGACAAVVAGGAIPVLRGGIPDEAAARAIRAATGGRFIYSTPFGESDGERLAAILEALR